MKTSIIIQNLKCGGCVNTINTILSSINTISDIQVDVIDSKVSFKYCNTDDVLMVREKLKGIGYPSIEDSNSLASKAKSLISCATGKLSL